MATLFSDAFTRANGALGANWGTVVGGGPAAVASNQMSVTGAASAITLVPTSTTGHAAVANVKATVARITNAGYDGGPAVRIASGNYYYLDVYGSNNIELYRRVSGADTLIGNRNATHAANDTFGLEASGTGATVTFKVYRNGAQVSTDLTDTSGSRLTAVGQTGVISWNSGVQLFDDFLVEDLASAGYTGTGAATLALTAAAAGVHGVAGTASATLALAASGAGSHIAPVTGTGAATLTLAASATGKHGVTGTASKTLALTAAASGAHGVAGTASATLTIAASGAGAFASGVAGAGSAVLAVTASGVGKHGVSGAAAAVLVVVGAGTGSAAVVVVGTGASVLILTGAGVGLLGWAPVPTTSEAWTGQPATPETWTAASATSETWTAQSPTSETWTPATPNPETWH